MQKPDRTKLTAVFCLVAGILFWAGNSIAGRLSVGAIPPVSLAFWRWVFAFIVLLPFAWPQLRGKKPLIWKHRYQLLILAVLSISCFNTLLYLAAQTTQALNIVLIQTSLPLLTFLFSFLLLKQLPTKRQIIGLLFISIGLATVLSRGNLQHLINLEGHTGDILMITAVSAWGLYSVLLKRFSIPLPGVALLSLQIGIGVILLMPFYLIEFHSKGGFELNQKTLLLIAYVALFASILSYLSWNNGVKVLGSNAASMFNGLLPIFTALLALLILKEPLYSYHFIGGGFIILGLKYSLLQKRTI